jgi:tRNA-dihydrouridine synthase A
MIFMHTHRLCVAPMMERTDRHCRYLLRLIAPHALLYTEMLTANALVNGDARRLLRFEAAEHPVALQLGGNDPERLAAAAALGAAEGYDEINLNVGCPSGRVQSGCFGVALMRSPELVADAIVAIRERVALPVTVKTRIGVDHDDSYEFLRGFAERVFLAGCRVLIVHARKAWLNGLSPKQNRDIPPLDYARVHRLKQDFPGCEIILNGGIIDCQTALAELHRVDGVMLGRAAYDNPMLLADLDAALWGGAAPTRAAVFGGYLEYMRAELERGTPLRSMSRHLMGLYLGRPGSRYWRRSLGTLPEGAAGLGLLQRLGVEIESGSDSLRAAG